MAIKTKTSRDTYRSNVKERPLRQNGLEAHYQGLDITEVNIDHAGLAIIGRGGHQTRRDIRKVRKQYIVDVPQEEHNPTAELVFLSGPAGSPFDVDDWDDGSNSGAEFSLQNLDGATFDLTGSTGTAFRFQFYNGTDGDCDGDPSLDNDESACTLAGHTWTPLASSPYSAGDLMTNGNRLIDITGNLFSKRELMIEITGSIETVFPEDTFRFELYPSGSKQVQYGFPEPVTILEDKIVLILSSSVAGSAALDSNSAFLDDSNGFDDQAESHEWRLNGFLMDNSDPRTFYEDLRTDTIQSTEPHSFRSSDTLFRQSQFPAGDDRNNYDRNIGRYTVNGIAGDPTQEDRFATHDSAEVLIRQYPKREEIFDTHRGNHQWREDIHYLSPDQQVWSRMEALATNYHSSLTAHIEAMMNSNFADEQYIDPNPLSGRVDALNRLSRIFDTHTNLIFERHQNSVFDQYLDPIDDFRNLQENRFPQEDVLNSDAPFEDVQGTRQDDKCLWNDYFDQPPLENHDFVEEERWTRIDDEMLDILTFNANRGIHIDTREWQTTDYVYTATGFINSQTSGQDGIIYREMKR